MLFFTISASAPLTVVAGAVVATLAITGVTGIPLSFLILTGALYFFTVAYVAMARYVSNAGVFYAYLAQGLGRSWGTAGALVAMVSYNAIQISLYGLVGATMSGLMESTVSWPWYIWSLLVWAAIALLGILHININARVLAVLLIAEILVILLFDLAAFANPAEGSISFEPFSPDSLFVPGIGGVLAFGVASFVGYESAPVYGEEARGHHTVARASFVSLFFIGLLYAVSAWALIVAAGRDNAAAGTADPFAILDTHYGGFVSWLASLLLITSVFGAMLSFHNSVARYVFALSRERVLPASLDRIGTGSRGGAPIGGSLVQSAIALMVVLLFVLGGADPVATLFTLLSAVAAMGVLLLCFGTAIAAIRFFHNGGGTNESAWQRVIAPLFGAIGLSLVLVVTVVNIDSVLGKEPGHPLTWILPGIVLVSGIIGLIWGATLRRSRPEIYGNIGQGQPEPLEVPDHALADVKV
jgi:amino acid transporter